MKHLDSEKIAAIMRNVLLKRGVLAEAADHVVQSLIETSLRGVDSHGIHLFPHYCRAVDGGRINLQPQMKLQHGGPAVAVLNADRAFGHHAGAVAMDTATTLAREQGIAAVGVRNSSHFGAASYFALRTARRNFIAFAFTNADALVKAHAAKARFFGTNPICFCAPLDGEDPLCLDMATSQLAWNKLRNMADRGDQLVPELAYDDQGRSVSDPVQAHSLAPIGSYKGYGLGLMVDVLCALLPDGPISPDILPMYGTDLAVARQVGHFFMAIDISRFTDAQRFGKRLRDMSDRLRGLEPIDPRDPTQVAGDPEKRIWVQRVRDGIPVSDSRFQELIAVDPQFHTTVIHE